MKNLNRLAAYLMKLYQLVYSIDVNTNGMYALY